jgi:predicted metal-dependent enzyme (double-stranded beta helix superfamily)
MTVRHMENLSRFRVFVAEFTRLMDRAAGDEARLLDEGGRLLEALIAHDDWLPEDAARSHPQYYQQHLLHCDALERFSVVSFVWGPGQKTPVHDHTVWGLIGVLRGAELCRRFERTGPGLPMRASETERLLPGTVDRVSPAVGDIHEVANACEDRVSISIHVYGANIGAVKRHVFDAATGAEKPFVSGYSSPTLPNIWDRSAEVRASIR